VKKFVLCLACIAIFGLPVMASDVISVEFTPLLERARQGNAEAQFEIGKRYENGSGVSTNAEEAVKWYKLAAEQGHTGAQLDLGKCYYLGKGVAKNDVEAIKYFRLAAGQGCAQAKSLWAGLAADDERLWAAFLLFWAQKGDAKYQGFLGNAYYNGNGVPQDCTQAAKWFRLAAEQGDVLAVEALGCYDNLGDKKESAKWCRVAAENGSHNAQGMMGVRYYEGDGVLEDYVEAYAWCVISAMNGNEASAKNKDILKNKLNSLQIAAGQERAKELVEVINRKKQLAKLPVDQTPSADISPSGFGSGFLVKGGYVVTCWHVVENSKKISVSCQGKDFNASVVQKDEGNDIAILRVEGADAGASLSFSDSVKLGAQVFTMGFPHPDLQGSDVKFTTGSISGLTGPGNTPVYYQISAPLQSGNSGGPLFDEYGNLVGIVAAKLDSLKMLVATGDLTQNVNYAIKSDYLVPILKTVDGIKIQPSQTKPVNLLSLVEELKKSVVMIKMY
jgi:TPR repeat protein